MTSLPLRRHAHSLATIATFGAAAVASGATADRRGALLLGLGLGLTGLHGLVEWLGIEGPYERRVPRSAVVVAARVVWTIGLAVSVVDGFTGRWTPDPGGIVRGAGVALALGGILLRLWAMRALAAAFTYDLRVTEGQALVRAGPYRLLRHPAYTGMLLWSCSLAAWNPSLPGFALVLASTLVQIVHRIGHEERLLEAHYREAWREHARATWRLVPLVW